MSVLDPPAAAARRQNVLDRYVELLVGWGCPLERAEGAARELLDVALAHGYALPTVLDGVAPRGGGSTPEGRARARAVFDAAVRARHAADERPADGLEAGPGYLDPPPGAPAATDGLAS